MRTSIITGLTTVIAAAAIAAPAQAQTISPAQPSPTPTPVPDVSPAQPAVPTNLQPAGPTIQLGTCTVARSSHGYAYASCSVIADNVPFGQTVTLSYNSNLKTFKPRTRASWSNRTGTIVLANNGGLPGQVPGTTSTEIGGIKLAFPSKTVSQVSKELILGATGVSANASLIGPIASVTSNG